MARKNGERGKYVGRGRFAEKNGKQVTSFFNISSDNEKIKHIYGNYGFWSWLRYWYIDTANQVTMMLIDKGYYDYDFEQKKEQTKQVLYEETVKSDSEVRGLLARFGIGAEVADSAEQGNGESLEELQEMAMKQIAQGDSQVHKKG